MSSAEVHSLCGTPLPQWPEFGPLISIRDDDATKLLQFYKGELDQVKCQGCGRPLSVRPSLVVSFNEYTLEFIHYGPLARQNPDFISEIEAKAKADGNTVLSGYESSDELRAIAWEILADRAAAFYRALNTVLSQAGQEAWDAAWPDVSSSACAAMVVSGLGDLGVPIDPGLYNSVASYSREIRSRGIQKVQARTWASVCERWLLTEPPATTLEQDFQKYLATSAVLGGAPELFFEHIASLDLKKLNEGVRYAYYAAEATLHWLLQTPNPHADAWASSYLALETAHATCENGQSTILEALSVSDQRAKNTIERQSLALAVSQSLVKGPRDEATHKAVQEAVTKAGHPDLVGAGYALAKFVRKDGGHLAIDELAEIMRYGLEQWSDQPRELEAWFNLMEQSLPEVSVDQLVALAQDLEKSYLNNPIALAIERGWLGRILVMKRQPQPFLAHIGVKPVSWESETPLEFRCILWLWRGRALRLTARPRLALELLSSLVNTDRDAFMKLKPHIQQNVVGDIALAYIDLGQLETALAMQTAILDARGAQRTPWHLRAAAGTYHRLGRYADAIPLWREALATAIQSEAKLKPALEADLAYSLTLQGEKEEALHLLGQIPDDALSNPEIFIPYAMTLLNIGFDGLPEETRSRLRLIGERIPEIARQSLQNSDTQLYLTAIRLIALVTSSSENLKVWELLESDSSEFEGSPDPMALLALARRDWEQGETNPARRRLLEFTKSIAARYADTRDVSISLHALEQHRSELNSLGDQVARAETPSEDTRFIGELQRDLLGRIAARSRVESVSGFVAPDDEVVCGLASDCRPVGVLEWISGTNGIRWLLTTVDEVGRVRASWLQPPRLDLQQMRHKLHQRLQNWYLGRPGDPFELPVWRSFESWLAQALAGQLLEAGTLVVIEHTELLGIPWHVAAAPRWHTSYVPSWTALIKARDTRPQMSDLTLGLAMVPKFHESAANVAAMEESLKRTEEIAESLGCQLQKALMGDCDSDGLLRVLESSSVAKILCHGFVSPSDNVVALFVAHGGIVPPADSLTAATESGRKHLFDWRDLRHLQRAPSVVFSAACSSGRSHLAGIGERLGLFSILRGMGTRSLIAPRWYLKHLDVTLPILDKAMEGYLRNGGKLGEALHAACSEAEQRHPRWLAWTLSLEGDWR